MDSFISHGDIPPAIQTFVLSVTMESIFSLDHFSAIAANLHYVLLLGQPLPEFPCTAWHISSQPAPSVPLVLGQCVLLVSPASRMYFGHLMSIVKIEKSSLCPLSPQPMVPSSVTTMSNSGPYPVTPVASQHYSSTLVVLTYSGHGRAVILPLSTTLGLIPVQSLLHLAVYPALT